MLLTIAAAAFFVLKVRRFAPGSARATDLAPAGTIFFAHAPDVRETVKRFQKTGLYAIWQEPETQEFMQKPRKTSAYVQQWEARLARLARVAPGEAFLAVTSMDAPQPKYVAGFSFAGKRREVEALLAEPRAEFRQRWPSGKSEFASHKGAAIEVFTYPEGLLAECFVRNWYFIASDPTLLRSTLDRYEDPSSPAAGALTVNEVFQNATAPLGGASDIVLFGRRAAFGEGLSALMPVRGQPARPKAPADANKIQAIAAATRIDGTQMRDTVFIFSPGAAKETLLSRSTLALSGAETFLYFALGITSLTQLPDSVGILAGTLPGVAAAETALAERKLGWKDFADAFGPEMGTTIEWLDDAVAPAMLLAFEVRDAVKARQFLDAITSGDAGVPAWSRRDESGVSIYSAPSEGLALTSLTVAIAPRFAILGFSADAVAAGLRRMAAVDATDRSDSPLQEAAKHLEVPTSGFGYLDAAALIERSYKTLRPALTMSLALSGDLGDYIDAGKLPSAQVISRHLTPSVFTQSATESGILMESTGTLTFTQLIIGAIAGATTAFPAGETANPLSDVGTPAPSVTSDIHEPAVAVPVESGRPKTPAADEPEPALLRRP